MANPFSRDRLMSIDEYFAFEDASAEKHEYVDGQVHAMSGATREHSRIATNIAGHLWGSARGGPCRVHRGEVKLRAGRFIYYPDVMVACGSPPRDPRIEDAPGLVVEVVSPSTERTDRGEKLLVYRGIPALAAYLIVEQDQRCVERYWRGASGEWQRELVVGSGEVAIPHAPMSLTLDDIYEGVEMPSPEERLRLREEAAAYG